MIFVISVDMGSTELGDASKIMHTAWDGNCWTLTSHIFTRLSKIWMEIVELWPRTSSPDYENLSPVVLFRYLSWTGWWQGQSPDQSALHFEQPHTSAETAVQTHPAPASSLSTGEQHFQLKPEQARLFSSFFAWWGMLCTNNSQISSSYQV